MRANPTASFVGNNFKLTKTNANEVWLVDLGDTGLGDIEVGRGCRRSRHDAAGQSRQRAELASGTTLINWHRTNALDKLLSLANASVTMSVGSNVWVGTVTLSLTNTFGIDSHLRLPVTEWQWFPYQVRARHFDSQRLKQLHRLSAGGYREHYRECRGGAAGQQ